MRKLRLINLMILILFLLSISVGSYAQDEEAPDFSLFDYKSRQIQSFKDIITTRVNIMIITSTTCVSCISELRAMDWIRAKYRGDMSVTTVFTDRGGEDRVFRYLDYYAFDLDRFLMDPGGTVPARFKAPTVPTMIMFDRKGVEQYRKEGYKNGDESLIISKAEEIMYPRRAVRRTPSETAASSSTATPSAAPKTTGCASTG
ncbi:MAG: hypothetical protein JSV70_06795 [bacterium]|nr:MAG: hypothetical protein JSV70_06795 [bacterium]